MSARRTVLSADLKERHVNMMAFSACIGFGLFLQSGKIIYIAGPGLAIVAVVLASSVMWSVIACLGEMTALFPVQGPLFEFPGRFIDEAVGYATGWISWFAWVVILAAEVLAIAQLWRFRFEPSYLREIGYPDQELGWSTEHYSPAVWVFLFLILIGVINLLPVKQYGQLEYFFGVIKIMFISLLIVFNVIVSAIQLVPHSNHFWTWNKPWGFASDEFVVHPSSGSGVVLTGEGGKFLALWTAVVASLFSFVGFETIAITAPENRDLEKHETIKLATKKLTLRITILYVLGTFVGGLNVPYDDLNLVNIQINSVRAGQNSIFVLAAVRNHIRIWPSIFNGFFIFSATTSGINALYNSSRLLHALASIPEAWPVWSQNTRRRLERTTDRGVPLGTVTVSWLFGLVAFLAIKPFPSVVLGRITNNAVVSELICYTVICLSYIVFYHQIKQAANDPSLENRSAFNRDDKQYPYRTHGQLFRAWYGFVFCILLILFNNWRAFYPPLSLPDIISSYVGVSCSSPISYLEAKFNSRFSHFSPWSQRTMSSLMGGTR
ncbi:amino acid permease/ SLC12A domain-containing protein [Phaeosphaeriaceae sp. PMI808]|nr:amino acid permease/ SLC12A domain-containing protein [Phaeosphaeriaceae sp. PMI808]